MGDDMDRSLPPAGWEQVPFAKWWDRGRRILRWFSFCLLTGFGLALFTLLYLKSKPLPPPPIGMTTQLMDIRGKVIDQLDAGEHRDPVRLRKIPQSLIDATLAAEDQRFFDHWGFSTKGILRAAWINLKSRRVAQGASTITQQLARNLYLTHDRTWTRKLREAALTTQLELHFSKREILEMYLNKIYYGHGAYGVERAAHIYFHKPARSLNLAECAMLAGIPRGPGYYSPLADPRRAKRRQELILTRMAKAGFITRRSAEEAKRVPLHYGRPPRPIPARAPWFRDYVIQSAVSRFGLTESQVRSGGLKIYTTLDPARQEAAEKAVARYLNTQDQLEGALVSVDPRTGAIQAMVGGRDYSRSQYNRVFARRQPGSTFKPILYLAALEQGLTPVTRFDSKPTTFLFSDGKYAPTNYHGRYANRPITMGEAIATSDNVYAVRTLLEIGREQAVRMGKKLGIDSSLTPVPSLALGSSAVRPFEMIQVYSTLANGGVKHSPFAIRRIEDTDGQVIARAQPQPTSVIPRPETFVITKMLEKVFASGGTAHRVKQILPRPVAGKTGSTEWDSWLSGYTPDLATTVWLGYDRGKRLPPGTSRLTHNIWGTYMREALATVPPRPFPTPEGVTEVTVDPDTGYRATSACPRREKIWFLNGTEPEKTCPAHREPSPVPKTLDSLWERIKKWWDG
ncbi:transglycosylase domain-containing protein [Salinithrix halophila]|uniref:Transglycosylase domain-containing protein n=1 Tax=Salinithrix halophila TaxID=1485204 RepID=A0ABV8JKI6_9BACL